MPYKLFDVAGVGAVTIYKRRASRSLRISLGPQGIRVSIPLWATYASALRFVESKRSWIVANAAPPSAPLESGRLVGKTRQLTLVLDPEISGTRTSVRHNEVIVWYGPNHQPTDATVQHAAELACWRALKAESAALLTPRLNDLAARYGFEYRSLNFKRMKSRWGSCDHHTNIVINIFLVQLPWDCIDYVLLHELTHTRVLHHGADFWQALERVLPGARSFKRTMRAYQPTLL